jgi:small subunit ribosomal protein S3
MKKEGKPKLEELPQEIEILEETQIDPTKPRTESEVIELEEKLIETVETFEEVEEELK